MREGKLDLISELSERVVEARPELKETVDALRREGAGREANSRQIRDRHDVYNPFDGQTPCLRALDKFIETCPAYVKSEQA